MVQKCSLIRTLEIFFIEPTTIHFIKEISRKIKLAPTSIRNNIKELLKNNLIKIKKTKPFNGFIANRESNSFIFYKRIYNLYSLKNLIDFLVESYYPKLVVVYGSYSLGEDIESSDIDIIIIKSNNEIKLGNFEKKLKRKIQIISINDLNELDINLKKKVLNGIVLYGGF